MHRQVDPLQQPRRGPRDHDSAPAQQATQTGRREYPFAVQKVLYTTNHVSRPSVL